METAVAAALGMLVAGAIAALFWKEWRDMRQDARDGSWSALAAIEAASEAEATPQEEEEAQPLDSRLDIGDPAGEPDAEQVGDGPSPPARMSRRDMFAAGFYGGLGFLAATAIVWVAFIAVAVALVLALAGDNR